MGTYSRWFGAAVWRSWSVFAAGQKSALKLFKALKNNELKIQKT